MSDFTIGAKVAGHRAEVRLVTGSAAGTRYPRLGIDDHRTLYLVGRGKQAQQHRCGIAPRIGYKPRRRDFLPVYLGQPKHRFGQKVWAGMLEPVPSRIRRRVLQTEVGAEVDHPAPSLQELGYYGVGLRMRIAHEHNVRSGKALRRVLHVLSLDPQRRKHVRDPSPHIRLAGEGLQGHLRMLRQDVGEYNSRISGRTDDACRGHARAFRPLTRQSQGLLRRHERPPAAT